MKYINVDCTEKGRETTLVFHRTRAGEYQLSLMRGGYDDLSYSDLQGIIERVEEEFLKVFSEIKELSLGVSSEGEGCCEICYTEIPTLNLRVRVGKKNPKPVEEDENESD